MTVAERTRVPVEQAIARGESDTYIAEHCDVPIDTVQAVRAALDRINAEKDQPTVRRRGGRPLQPCGTRSAYERHRRRGEDIDELCRRAKYQYGHEISGRP